MSACRRTLSKKFAVLLLALAPLWAQAQSSTPVHIDSVGYDVARGLFVIHGSNFVLDEAGLAPDVLIGGMPAQVESFSGGFITARKPEPLLAGDYRVVVERRAHTDEGTKDTRSEFLYFLGDVAMPAMQANGAPPPRRAEAH